MESLNDFEVIMRFCSCFHTHNEACFIIWLVTEETISKHNGSAGEDEHKLRPDILMIELINRKIEKRLHKRQRDGTSSLRRHNAQYQI